MSGRILNYTFLITAPNFFTLLDYRDCIVLGLVNKQAYNYLLSGNYAEKIWKRIQALDYLRHHRWRFGQLMNKYPRIKVSREFKNIKTAQLVCRLRNLALMGIFCKECNEIRHDFRVLITERTIKLNCKIVHTLLSIPNDLGVNKDFYFQSGPDSNIDSEEMLNMFE